MADQPWDTTIDDRGNYYILVDSVAGRNYIADAMDREQAEYIVMLHPPVALALVELLKACADHAAVEGYLPAPAITAVAREILREPS